ncbi:lipid-A-disaccharide synthase [Pelagibacterium montanilacus]|uniref:lipid-A-disaccharide synthase n=1 Tax=Pelagibacterium montanilacus TaxID=2185280 RepID=UPI0013DE7FF3|nr:lipid-A-disaccharide synthase [Pelagibacterium montanilacus]
MTRIFILAGEASGDRIGASLMADLQAHDGVSIVGVGGEAMIEHGLDPIFPMHQLSVMGYADVIVRLPRLLWRALDIIRTVRRTRPDVTVLIDSQVFSQVVAKGLRALGYDRPILLYVAPSVWAWKPERAKAINPLYDEVLSVLPFEPAAMLQLDGPPTTYVGHPALARFPMRTGTAERGPLLLLPGSRSGELRRHLPMMRTLAIRLADHAQVSEFIVPTTRQNLKRIEEELAGWPVSVRAISGELARRSAMAEALAAVCVSGTATLELAVAGVPHLITYVAEPAQAKHFETATTRYVGLPNIIAQRNLVPEHLFVGEGDADVLGDALTALVEDPEALRAQVQGFAEIREQMEKGAPEAPLHRAADRVLARAGD